MRKFTFLCIILISGFVLNAQKVVFLHHSTGGNLYNEGGVASWIQNYNLENSTDYLIKERSYPNTPYPWANYPYDYWNLWINGECDNNKSGIECLESICDKYDVVIWKHCFPGASINESSEAGDVASSTKTLANYKEQYRALRTKMDEIAETKFIIWTLVPVHRLTGGSPNRERAQEFVEWVKSDWLTEDGKQHPNIYIFDFFSLAAELNAEPQNGLQYCLKYDYEKSHESSDSHPNQQANQTIGPIFAEFIVEVIEDEGNNSVAVPEQQFNYKVFPNPTEGIVFITGAPLDPKEISIMDILGQKMNSYNVSSNQIDISNFRKGIYLLLIKDRFFRIVKQ